MWRVGVGLATVSLSVVSVVSGERVLSRVEQIRHSRARSDDFYGFTELFRPIAIPKTQIIVFF